VQPDHDLPRGPGPLTVRALAVRVILVLAVVGVLGLWWLDTPATAGATPGTVLTSGGELTGMVAGLLICVQILLVARIPWLERAIGQDRLVTWHRILGTSALLLTVTHVFLIVVGGKLTDQATLWSELTTTTLTQQNVLTALIGTIVLVLAGVSSAAFARRHLSYEAWYWLHTTTYVAVFLTFAHQINAGAHFVGSPVNRLVWTLLYLGTGVAVVVWRILLPAAAVIRHRVRVDRVVVEAPGVSSVWLRGARLDELNARAGQFFTFRFLTPGHLATAHPYSVSFVPREDRMRITVGALGDHSSVVQHLRPGTFVIMQGPFGRFTADRARATKVLLVAGGVGIGPIATLAHELRGQGRDVVVIHRAPTAADLPLSDELSGQPGLRFVPLLGHRSTLGYDPLSPAQLRLQVPDVRQREVFVCGSPGLSETVTASVRSLGVARRHIHQEELSMS
jgi:predicted ferric reductase